LVYFILFRCQNDKINAKIKEQNDTHKISFYYYINTFTIKLKLKAYYIELLKHLNLMEGAAKPVAQGDKEERGKGGGRRKRCWGEGDEVRFVSFQGERDLDGQPDT